MPSGDVSPALPSVSRGKAKAPQPSPPLRRRRWQPLCCIPRLYEAMGRRCIFAGWLVMMPCEDCVAIIAECIAQEATAAAVAVVSVAAAPAADFLSYSSSASGVGHQKRLCKSASDDAVAQACVAIISARCIARKATAATTAVTCAAAAMAVPSLPCSPLNYYF